MSVKDCCKKEENLKQIDSGRQDLKILVCQVCQCKHYKLKVDPAKLFAKETK